MAVDHDRLFKELITTFFEEFILLFFPDMYEHIDFRHLSFLSEELFTDVTAGEKYRVDLLVETKLKGEDGLIIVHIENQSYVQPSFPERMFIYFSRLFEKYRTNIVPITVFSYDAIRDEPSSFTLRLPFGNILHFRFFTVELRKQNWRHYIRNDNPIAAALLSKMGYTESERIELKKQFLRMLVRMELDEAKQRLLIGFFETYVQLSDEEEQQLRNEVNKMETKEKEQVLELLISYEQKGLKEGVKKGLQQEKRQIAKKMLVKGYDIQTIHELTELPIEEIEKLK
ncbi:MULTISPECIES: Rpn family recombination-promoting nuclease/putative transposase [unclassified Geobacillus]|uniref:Rpn family recombination-promoting nuclease/putative transposase n=1 Tax=unclassified Geobacillus TaxID=2642459 RepID=UPI000BE2B186|nr:MULTISPECIES: Rpn family recombination-promoting nuclease/putative transposase [unclassified Geobacillus]PDM39689.1 transposase [Parageobacillus yumthangensis]RDV21441.1 Rpn family recombination-promoting nuclease/putative transposase [Parageobacillus toebii]TXK91863.1 Rpn family recombination-promoting nuclease/putative transposase [Parageobacillus sp. SY1]PUF88299.1 Rpn family recombination-promoting nuclease/putative transposase [Geobacillus sp. LYN3]TXK86916.1 Rpn family recombination-p